MDYSNPLGIEYRVVKEAEYLGQAVRVVSGTRSYDAEIEQLWDAVTNSERIPRWFAPITGDLKLNGRYQIEGNAGGKITRCDPPEAFDITWEYSGNVSWVMVRLERDGDATRLTLDHLMCKDQASEQHWKKYGPSATGVGWELGFLGLELHLKSGGEAIDQEANTAWMTSAAGRDFMRASAKGWGEAHIQAGEDPDTARRMAEQTAAFYCGDEHEH